MTVFRPHEVEVVRLLASESLSAGALGEIIEAAQFVELDETSAGYFLSVRHPILPEERLVCQHPLLRGRSGDVECGFVVFVEGGLLMLECHSWGESIIPAGFREWDVRISEMAPEATAADDASRCV